MKPTTKCSTPYCRNKRAWDRLICWKCKSRRFNTEHPHAAAYNRLKQNAKRRGKQFTLTYSEFIQFCTETNYLDKRGRTRKKCHIDRIDNEKGYTAENIRILTSSENIKKQHSEDFPY